MIIEIYINKKLVRTQDKIFTGDDKILKGCQLVERVEVFNDVIKKGEMLDVIKQKFFFEN